MKALFAPAALILSACAAGADLPPEGTPYIEISTFNSMFGGETTRIHRGDIIEARITGAPGEPVTTRVTEGRPGLFVALAAVIAAEGPGTVAALGDEAEGCVEGGDVAVRAVPAIGGFAEARASGCPDAALSGLVMALDAVIAG